MALKYLVLGMLHQYPMSGYDLDKAFQETATQFWTTDRSQIYRTLHKLYDDGLLRMEYIPQEDNPDKKVYHVTETGREELRQWLLTPLMDEPVREAWLGQVFLGDLLTNEELSGLLQTYQSEIKKRWEMLQFIQDQYFAKADIYQLPRQIQLSYLTLQNGLQSYKAQLEWLDQTLNHIQHMNDN